jgi:aryl-alcohol dehydrogenase-like predicted oxidoreductase
MAQIALPGIAFRTPAGGFGCSSLTGTGPGEANPALETAFDAGVGHFDTARHYGYAGGGGILERFLKGHRSGVTTTTKVGIEPPQRITALVLH